MTIVLVTGSAGLIGSESVRFFGDRGFTVVGIDNNMRSQFFGEDASTEWNRYSISRFKTLCYGQLRKHISKPRRLMKR